jgi:hypothetical protein
MIARILVILVGLLPFLPVTLLAHSWYPQECCNGRDCGPIDSSRVQVTETGYIVDGMWKYDFKAARLSEDNHYHLCQATTGMPLAPPYCFFAPRGTT